MDTTDETAEVHPGETLSQPIPADAIPVRDPSAPIAPAMPAGFDTVENWARAKGMLPEFREVEHPRNPKKLRPKAKPMLIHNTDHAPFRAAKDVNHWPIGMEMSEADFDKAIAAQTAHVYR